MLQHCSSWNQSLCCSTSTAEVVLGPLLCSDRWEAGERGQCLLNDVCPLRVWAFRIVRTRPVFCVSTIEKTVNVPMGLYFTQTNIYLSSMNITKSWEAQTEARLGKAPARPTLNWINWYWLNKWILRHQRGESELFSELLWLSMVFKLCTQTNLF